MSVTVASSNSAAAPSPGAVPVPPGAASFTFNVTTIAGTTDRSTTFSVSYNGGLPATSVLMVRAVALQGLNIAQSVVTGGSETATLTVVLSSPAPAGGLFVNLNSSDKKVLTVSNRVPVTGTSATVTLAPKDVASQKFVTVTGTYAGVSRVSNTLTVN
jgi:hypothetical protein